MSNYLVESKRGVYLHSFYGTTVEGKTERSSSKKQPENKFEKKVKFILQFEKDAYLCTPINRIGFGDSKREDHRKAEKNKFEKKVKFIW